MYIKSMNFVMVARKMTAHRRKHAQRARHHAQAGHPVLVPRPLNGIDEEHLLLGRQSIPAAAIENVADQAQIACRVLGQMAVDVCGGDVGQYANNGDGQVHVQLQIALHADQVHGQVDGAHQQLEK